MFVRHDDDGSDVSDPHFDSLQLDLPLRESIHEVETEDQLSLDWRSSHSVLTEYLQAISVTYPETAARALISEFGSLSDLLAGSCWRMRRVVGSRVARAIAASRKLMRAALAEKLDERPLLPGSANLIDFLRMQLGHLPHEQLLALYVDDGRHLLRIEKVGDGPLTGVAVDFRKIVLCGLRVGASGILLVHNHPSGNPQPSTADLKVTARLRGIIEHLDMHLLDHLIIAREQVGSIDHFWRERRFTGEIE